MATLNHHKLTLSIETGETITGGFGCVILSSKTEDTQAYNLVEVNFNTVPLPDELSLNQATWLANQIKAFTETLDIPHEDQFGGEPGQLASGGEFKLRVLEDYVAEKIVDPHIDWHTRLVIEELWHEVQLQTMDADRWRALISSDRIRMMGCVGFDLLQDPIDVREGYEGNLHLGMEVWDKHPAKGDESDVKGRAVLMAYVNKRVKEWRLAGNGQHQWHINKHIMQDGVEKLHERLDQAVIDHMSVILDYDEVCHLVNTIKTLPPIRKELREDISIEMFNTNRMINGLPTVDSIDQAPAARWYRDGADRVMTVITKAVDQQQ